MAFFTPPTDNFVTPVLADFDTKGNRLSQEQRLANRLARHTAPTARGRNVFLLTDGSFTEAQPASWSSISKVYYGGHSTEITTAEATALTEAGYGAYIA